MPRLKTINQKRCRQLAVFLYNLELGCWCGGTVTLPLPNMRQSYMKWKGGGNNYADSCFRFFFFVNSYPMGPSFTPITFCIVNQNLKLPTTTFVSLIVADWPKYSVSYIQMTAPCTVLYLASWRQPKKDLGHLYPVHNLWTYLSWTPHLK